MSPSEPLVSIVLPTFNGSRYIATSIESVLAQTYRSIELIVVDGGSTDGTLDIVNRFQDPRIKVVQQANNAGRLPGALNLGFARAQGDYFTWTQDDDCYALDAVQVMLSYLTNHPDVGLVYAGFSWIDSEGKETRESDSNPPEALFWTNSVGHCFLYRRSIAEQVGEYDVAYLMSEDSNYWMRIFKRSKMAQIPGRYYYHRWHSGSLTVRDYGCYWALRVAARSRRQVLHINWLEYQRQVAAAFMEEAFAAYSNRDWSRVRRCLVRGLVRNPAWLRNRGVVSIGLQSMIGIGSVGPGSF
jgi:glycosyltransferase involved in cell wall biosynthesis